MKTTLLFLSVFLSVSLFGQQNIEKANCIKEVNLSKKDKICIVPIANMTECYDKFNEYFDLFEPIETNQTIAWYLDNLDFNTFKENVPEGPFDTDLDYYKVWIDKSLGDEFITREMFEYMQTMLKSVFDENIIDFVENKFEQNFGSTINLSKETELNTYLINKNKFSGKIVISAAIDGGKEKHKICAMNLIYFEKKGRMIFTACYQNFDGIKSISELNAKNEKFNSRFFSSNDNE